VKLYTKDGELDSNDNQVYYGAYPPLDFVIHTQITIIN